MGLAGLGGAKIPPTPPESHRLASVAPELNQAAQKRFFCRLSLQGVMHSLTQLLEHIANVTSLPYRLFRCMFTLPGNAIF